MASVSHQDHIGRGYQRARRYGPAVARWGVVLLCVVCVCARVCFPSLAWRLGAVASRYNEKKYAVLCCVFYVQPKTPKWQHFR